MDGQLPFASSLQPVPTELMIGLRDDNVMSWLVTFSKCGQDDLATVCIDYIRANIIQLADGFCSSGVQAKHVAELCNVFQDEVRTLRTQMSSLKQQMAAKEVALAIADDHKRAGGLLENELKNSKIALSAAQADVAYRRPALKAEARGQVPCRSMVVMRGNCRAAWYRKPNNDVPAEHYVRCGAAKQRFMTTSSFRFSYAY